MSYQKIIIEGFLGKDPETRFAPSGAQVASFSVATDRKYKGSDGQTVSETTWFRVSAWNKLAEICMEYLKKGSEVLVEGILSPDKNTGNPKVYQRPDGTFGSSYDIRASEVHFVGGRKQSESSQEESLSGEEEIPF